MGVLVGLLLGVGVLLVLASGTAGETSNARRSGWYERRSALLVEAGAQGMTPGQLVTLSALAGVLAAAVVLTLSATLALSVAFGGFAAAAPTLALSSRRRRLVRERRELWPHVVDDLASGVRAGLSLPEAVAALASRGPEPLRPAFAGFAEEHRATGSFARSLARLADDLADPVADRVVQALVLAREVGGTDLGRLLRTLSAFLREDARVRAELEARQGWTVNGARLALAAPWAVLLLLALRGGTVEVYDEPAGLLVLATGGAVSGVAYALMRRVARLPEERRLLVAGAEPAPAP